VGRQVGLMVGRKVGIMVGRQVGIKHSLTCILLLFPGGFTAG